MCTSSDHVSLDSLKKRPGGLHFGLELRTLLAYSSRYDKSSHFVFVHFTNNKLLTIVQGVGKPSHALQTSCSLLLPAHTQLLFLLGKKGESDT